MIKTCDRCGDRFIAKFASETRHPFDCRPTRVIKNVESAKRRREKAATKTEQRPDERRLGLYYARTYGITLEQYEKLARAQSFQCAICGESDEKLVVDHDHTTGKVRGLLCGHCNTGLGAFKDNTGAMERAIEYINGPRPKI